MKNKWLNLFKHYAGDSSITLCVSVTMKGSAPKEFCGVVLTVHEPTGMVNLLTNYLDKKSHAIFFVDDVLCVHQSSTPFETRKLWFDLDFPPSV